MIAAVEQGRGRAQSTRASLGLGSEAIPDLFHLLDDLGTRVVRFALGEDGPDGALLVSPELTVVLTNSSQRLSRQRFTAAHEYGHLLFDAQPRLKVDLSVFAAGRDISETRANAFAAHFLVPLEGVDRVVKQLGVREIRAATLVHLQFHFGVSYEVVRFQLLNAGVISKTAAGTLAGAAPERLAWELGYGDKLRADREDRDRTSLPPSYVGLAVKAYQTGRVSLSRLAELLRRDDEADLGDELEQIGICPAEATAEELARDVDLA
ncbi:MAG: hypothetical protein A2W26_07985 [Acidobacteria bacterium RBG_16_64_8]|nr:MAG: hypothetical protein A2W26_07985 [Acidobacteria bacterium RBG_16_64_8]